MLRKFIFTGLFIGAISPVAFSQNTAESLNQQAIRLIESSRTEAEAKVNCAQAVPLLTKSIVLKLQNYPAHLYRARCQMLSPDTESKAELDLIVARKYAQSNDDKALTYLILAEHKLQKKERNPALKIPGSGMDILTDLQEARKLSPDLVTVNEYEGRLSLVERKAFQITGAMSVLRAEENDHSIELFAKAIAQAINQKLPAPYLAYFYHWRAEANKIAGNTKAWLADEEKNITLDWSSTPWTGQTESDLKKLIDLRNADKAKVNAALAALKELFTKFATYDNAKTKVALKEKQALCLQMTGQIDAMLDKAVAASLHITGFLNKNNSLGISELNDLKNERQQLNGMIVAMEKRRTELRDIYDACERKLNFPDEEND